MPIYNGSVPFALKRGANAIKVYCGSTLISGGAAPAPVFGDPLTIEFGALTTALYGGHALWYSDGGTLSISSQLASGGGATTHFQITGNRLVPSAAGDTANLNAGPYTVTVTDGTKTSVVTVNILANTYHAAPLQTSGIGNEITTNSQLRSVMASTTVALGNTIKLRDGLWNVDGVDMRYRRTTGIPFAGAWSGVYDTATGQFDGANWVTITPDTPYGAVFRKATFEASTNPCALYTKVYQCCFVDGSAGTGNVLSLYGTAAASHILIDSCRLSANETSNAAATPGQYGLDVRSAIGSVGTWDYVTVKDCIIHDVYDGINLLSNHLTVWGNTISRVWNDAMKFSSSQNYVVSWNFVYDKFYGDGALHGDFLQWAYAGSSSAFAGGSIIGNIFSRGANSPTSDGGVGRIDGQGVFIDDLGVGGTVSNVVVRGNIYIGQMARGISITRGVSSVVEYNTVVYAYAQNGDVNTDGKAKIANVSGTGTGNYNVSNGLCEFAGLGNAAIHPSSYSNALLANDVQHNAAYGAPVDAASMRTKAAILAALAPKAGGPLDKAITGYTHDVGAVGNFDYTNRIALV